ncbi:hypothetical protein DFH07DRAFT_778844 [Mycena maculata]|uniref:Uncharacterized protein n=1 Tax=Mycena maculata TaxID=230809 RepID=A0AAD7MZB7_9AGAR|nr:hypothetical protein DFH07DRAFT_778844 [Mycena maculata]
MAGMLSEELCPRCHQANLTRPRCCTGTFNTENEGRYYQACAHNDFTKDALCSYFYWNDTVQLQFEGRAPNTESHAPQSSSRSSPFTATPTFASPSPRGRRQSTLPCTSNQCRRIGSGHTPQARHSACVQQFCKSCCLATSTDCSAPQHNRTTRLVVNLVTVATGPSSSTNPSPSHLPLVPAKAYARMIDPSYANKLVDRDFEVNNVVNLAAAYKKVQGQMVEVSWWFKNGEAAENFYVITIHFPYFHPKDSAPIVKFVGEANTLIYSYWTGSKWMRTDAAIPVKAGLPVFMRSADVTDCLDGPTAVASKRPRSFSSESQRTPTPKTRRLNNLEDLQLVPDCQPGLGSSPNDDLIYIPPQTDKAKKPSDVCQLHGLVIPSTNDFYSDEPTASQSQKSWPAHQYAVDMDAGFRAIGQSKGPVSARFQAAFKVPFKSATYYDNLAYWNGLSPEVQALVPWLLRSFAASSGSNPYITSLFLIFSVIFMSTTARFLITAQFLDKQVKAKKGFTIVQVKSISRAHHNVPRLQHSPSTLAGALALITQDVIYVDWPWIQGHEVDANRRVDTLLHREHYDPNMSPLSSLDSLLDTPMEDVDLTPIENVPNPAVLIHEDILLAPVEDVPNSPVLNHEDIVLVPVEDVPNPPVLDHQAEPDESKEEEPPAYTPEVGVKRDVWTLELDQFTQKDLWEAIAFDPEIDIRPSTPKVVIINYVMADPTKVEFIRYNTLALDAFSFQYRPTSLDDRATPSGAYTFNIFARRLLRVVLNQDNIPEGYDILDEFGPLATYYFERNELIWRVDKTYAIPILGPPDAQRILLVIRRRFKADTDVSSDEEMPQAPPLGPPVTGPIPPPPVNVLAASVGPITPGPNPPAPTILVPLPTTVPAQVGPNTVAINDATVAWLVGIYGRHPLVVEIRGVARRGPQLVPKLVEWAAQIDIIRLAHPKVAETPEAGVATGHTISQGNLGNLFNRGQGWIKSALKVHALVKVKRTTPAVAALIASSQAMGMQNLSLRLSGIMAHIHPVIRQSLKLPMRHVSLQQTLLLQYDFAAYEHIIFCINVLIDNFVDATSLLEIQAWRKPRDFPFRFWTALIDRVVTRSLSYATTRPMTRSRTARYKRPTYF